LLSAVYAALPSLSVVEAAMVAAEVASTAAAGAVFGEAQVLAAALAAVRIVGQGPPRV